MELRLTKAAIDRGDIVNSMLVLCVASIFMTSVGAFGTWRAPLAARFPYWIVLMACCGGGLFVARHYIERWSMARLTGLRLDIAVATMTAPLFVLIVASASRIAIVTRLGDGRSARLLGSVLIVSAALLSLRRLVVRDTAGPDTDAAPVETAGHFLHRLPFRLRTAAILAVEADDHYLRVYTDVGEAYLHMRLGDAVSELSSFDGMRVHRSWWVARQSIVSARWRRGRGTLQLIDGRCVPVSRSHAHDVRRQI